jgi:hypothetical protein
MITETIQYKQLVRMRSLAQQYGNQVPKPGRQALESLTSELNNLGILAGSEACALGKKRESSGVKEKARAELRADIAAIYRIAAAIALETPGFADKFQTAKLGDQKLLAAGRSNAEAAAPLSDVFVKHALAADFIKVLNANIRNFEEAVNNYAQALRATEAVAGEIEATTQKAVAASKLLDAIVRNTLRDDPAKLAEWARACHSGVKRIHAKKPEPPPAPAAAA